MYDQFTDGFMPSSDAHVSIEDRARHNPLPDDSDTDELEPLRWDRIFIFCILALGFMAGMVAAATWLSMVIIR